MRLDRPAHIPERDWQQAVEVTAAQARRYCKGLRPPLDVEAVAAAAWVGLWRASQEWQPGRGTRFPTLAFRWALGAMQDEARGQGHLNRYAQTDWEKEGRPAWGLLPTSLDAPGYVDADGQVVPLRDLVPDRPREGEPHRRAVLLTLPLEQLTERQREALQGRAEGLTFTALGARMGLKPDGAREHYLRALRNLAAVGREGKHDTTERRPDGTL